MKLLRIVLFIALIITLKSYNINDLIKFCNLPYYFSRTNYQVGNSKFIEASGFNVSGNQLSFHLDLNDKNNLQSGSDINVSYPYFRWLLILMNSEIVKI
jgi:hypothetical protein